MHIFMAKCSECGNLSAVHEDLANDQLDERKAEPWNSDPIVISRCALIRELDNGEQTCNGEEHLLGVMQVLTPVEIAKAKAAEDDDHATVTDAIDMLFGEFIKDGEEAAGYLYAEGLALVRGKLDRQEKAIKHALDMLKIHPHSPLVDRTLHSGGSSRQILRVDEPWLAELVKVLKEAVE